jgi:23S rRNA pseudouridine955/2504/2580 synthase
VSGYAGKAAPRAAAGGRDGAAGPPPGLASDRVTYVEVGPEGDGQRLDNFLLRLAKGVPKSHIYRIVRSGEVRVNQGRASVQQRLQPGDRLRIPPLRVPAQPAPQRVPTAMPPLLYEDEHLLVVDKPSGLAAHGGSGVSYGLIEQLRAARPQQPFMELAHRLDRETSGLLLVAKSRRALVALHEMLRDGAVEKRYLALAVGHWHNDRQHVKLALTKHVSANGERRVSVDAEGQASHTVFNLRRRFAGGDTAFSLLEAELKTGRTHQIRVHLAHLGFPIVGDDKYGDFALNKRVARGECGRRLERMFLHAWRIHLAHPVGGARLALEAPLPDDCDAFLRGLHAQAV